MIKIEIPNNRKTDVARINILVVVLTFVYLKKLLQALDLYKNNYISHN